MADFVISTELDATKIVEGARRSVNAALTMQEAFQKTLEIIEKVNKSGIKTNAADLPKISVNKNNDSLKQYATADIKQYETQRIRSQKVIESEIAKSEKAMETIRKITSKSATDSVVSDLGRIKKARIEEQNAAKETQSVFSSALGGSFFGNLGASAVTFFTAQLSKIPSIISSILDTAVTLAQERRNALLGLASIADFKGIDPKSAQSAVLNLRLVKAGIVDVSEATTGLKNLLATGFSLDKATVLMERFSDSAAFGKQAALSYGHAISSATEGIKNQNSVLVDNAGVTKNISVILRERGFEMDDLGNATKKQAALEALYKGLLKETAAQVGDADKITQEYTGTVAALEQAKKNLYVSIGNIITQSPEISAVYKLWAEEINDVTNALDKQDSQQRITFANFVAGTVKGAISAENFANGVYAVALDVVTGLSRIEFAFTGFVDYLIHKITTSIDLISNKYGDSVNNLIRGYNSVATYTGLPQVSELNVDSKSAVEAYNQNEQNYLDLQKAQEKYFQTEKGWFKNTRKAQVDAADRWTEYEFLLNQSQRREISAAFSKPKREENDSAEKAKKSRLSQAGVNEFVTDRNKARYQAALRNLSPDLRQMIEAEANQYGIPVNLALAQIFSESTFRTDAVSPYNPKVKSSAYGLTQQLPSTASHVLHRKVTGEELKNNPKTALSAWGEYMTFLFNRYGDWELATLAYHQGEGTVDKLVAILDSNDKTKIAKFLKSRPAGTAYVKQISALSGIRGDNQYQPSSEDRTKFAKDEITRAAIDFYDITKTQPSPEMAKRIAELRNRQLNIQGEPLVDEKDIAAEYRNKYSNEVTKSLPDSLPDAPIREHLSPSQDFVKQYREDLGLDKDYFTQIENGVTEVYNTSVLKEMNFSQIVKANWDAKQKAQKDSIFDIRVEWELIHKRNTAEEASLEFSKSRNNQLSESMDIERDILLLRKQNLDSQFVEQRQLLAAKKEQFSLEQNITQLQDQLANSGINDSLKIQEAYLKDIIDLRGRELEAVISINHSQFELSQRTKISNNEIKAQVMDHLAQQQNYNSAIASDIIDLYEKAGSAMDKFFNKLPFGANIAKAAYRSIVTNIAVPILDKIFPGADIGKELSKTGNPVVDSIATSNDYLKKIADNTSNNGLGTINISGGGSGGGAVLGGGGGSFGILGTIVSIAKQLLSGGKSAGVLNAPHDQSGGAAHTSSSNVTAPINELVNHISAEVRHDSIAAPVSITARTGETVTLPSGEKAVQINGGASSIFSNLSLKNIKASIASLAPGLLSGLGGSLGGGSGASGLLGQGGGLLAGTLLSGLLTSGGSIGAAGSTGILGSIGGALGLSGVATFGITAAIAGVLLLGSYLLGKNKQRRADETTRNQLSLDSFAAMDQLIDQVNKDRLDGQSALAQSATIRTNYLTQAGQLKDTKTRNIAIADVARVDQKIVILQQAVSAQETRQDVASKFKGEFATGGYIRGFADGGTAHPMFAAAMGYSSVLPKNYSGHIPGAFDRKDDILLSVSRGEHVIVMNPAQYYAVQDRLNPLMREAKVPGFANGGYQPPTNSNSSSGSTSSNSSGSGSSAPFAGTLIIESMPVTMEATIDHEGFVIKGLTGNAINIIWRFIKTNIVALKGRTSRS